MNEAHEGGHDTPCHGQGRQPDLRSGTLENDVAGDFEQNVTYEVHGEAGEILVTGYAWRLAGITTRIILTKLTHVHVVQKPFDSRVADCSVC